ncbi:MAG: hypothetical protein IJN43_16170 [Ruminococcus sp.]|nr:hypothetical protein [Oscillospiraceae bacterium]MBQ6945835.1 hypothetical protein [Ruminococcus sp.]
MAKDMNQALDSIDQRINTVQNRLEEWLDSDDLNDNSGEGLQDELEDLNQVIDRYIKKVEEEHEKLEKQLQDLNSRMDEIQKKLGSIDESDDARIALVNEYNSLQSERSDLNHTMYKHSRQLSDLKRKRDEVHHLTERHGEVVSTLRESTEKATGRLGTAAKTIVKKAAIAPVSIIKGGVVSTIKSTATKVNPLDKSITKEDVSDTGMEALRLGYGTAKKGVRGIKTVGRSIKTTQRTIKTTGTVVRGSGRLIYRTATTAVKVITTAARVAGNIAAHAVAAVMNPLFWVFVFLIILCLLIAGTVAIIFAGDNTDKAAYTGAAGLTDVSAEYQEALNYFNIAVQAQRDGFNGIIDSMYYSYSDLGHSDLVYMERTKADDTLTIYNKAYASDTYRGALKSQWILGITEQEGIAIAYVYLQKIQNTANGTENAIYGVTYTQDTFDTIVSKCVSYSDTTYTGQQCPSANCTAHIEYSPNPAYSDALEANNKAAAAFNDWLPIADMLYYYYNKIPVSNGQIAYWNNYIVPAVNAWITKYNRYDIDYTNNGNTMKEKLGAEYEAANAALNSTPATIETTVYKCDLNHTLHSLGLFFYNKEDVMNALGFTDAEKEWVDLTELGFQNNSELTSETT